MSREIYQQFFSPEQQWLATQNLRFHLLKWHHLRVKYVLVIPVYVNRLHINVITFQRPHLPMIPKSISSVIVITQSMCSKMYSLLVIILNVL